ncbi:MAG: methyltransferase domain-containing protein [Bauldia sp.]
MSAAFDAYARSYEDLVGDSIAFSGLKHDFFLTAKVRFLARLFAERFGEGARPAVLDVGCGVGRMHPLLAPLAGSLAGTDLSAEALARARADNPAVDYRTGSDGALPFADAAFDVTLAVCVAHHVPPADRPAFIAEMVRVTRPRGLVVLIEHNPWNPLTRLAVARCPFDADAVLLAAAEARRLLHRAGLGEVESRHFLLFPTAARIAEAVERRLARLPLGAQYAAVASV